MFNKKFLADAGERIVCTAAVALLAVLSTPGINWGQKMSVTGIAALGTALKTIVATQVGAGNTAALLPAGPDTEKG